VQSAGQKLIAADLRIRAIRGYLISPCMATNGDHPSTPVVIWSSDSQEALNSITWDR
jgi:hypothetical protein